MISIIRRKTVEAKINLFRELHQLSIMEKMTCDDLDLWEILSQDEDILEHIEEERRQDNLLHEAL